MSNSEKVKQELLEKLRSMSEAVTDSIGEIAKGKQIFVEESIKSKRLSLCNACPEFIKSTSQCKKCGCFMSAKTRLRVSSCPIGKWGRET